ncbi:MAG: prolipoprotein diacylglyceryl transferase [Acidobacteriota bacterium]|nr:prolipoprotein diacylglyceryl transferase [Acidobacteriota bacterium]
MYPELFRIFDFPINTYGVLLALSFLVALFVASRLGARDGLPRERIYDLGLWMLLGGLVGSKLLLMWVEPVYGQNLWHLFSLDFLRSGGVWYGGFIGGLVTGLVLMRRYKLPWWKTFDAFAPGVALGQAVGRQGCFAAGCCWGKPTSLPWGVQFTEAGHEVTGVPFDVHLHPTQLYESFIAILIFGLLLWLHRRKTFHGQVILAYVVLYSATRFIIEFFRADPRGDIAGLTTFTTLSTSQLISLAVGITGLIFLVLRWRRAAANSANVDDESSDASVKKARVGTARA